MSCVERDRIVERYKIAESDYIRVIMVLQSESSVMPKPEYRRLKEYTDKARLIAEDARAELDSHLARHACGTPGTARGE